MKNALRQYKASVFQALSHPTRVAIVEQLRYGEMSVGQLCERLSLEQANASQHLAVLRNKNIVFTRRDGNQSFYSLRDATMGQLLDLLRDFFSAHLDEALAVLREAQAQADLQESKAE